MPTTPADPLIIHLPTPEERRLRIHQSGPKRWRRCCLCGHQAKYRRQFLCRRCKTHQILTVFTFSYTDGEIRMAP